MLRACIFAILMMLVGSACTSEGTSPAPTAIPFPTVTPGREVSGLIATPQRAAINPATLAAQSRLPTATPDTGSCPASGEASLPRTQPENEGEIVNAILTYLSAGGSPTDLINDLRSQWTILDDGGFVRADFDLTGEDTPEIIISYAIPDSVGALLVLGCANGQYVVRFQDISEDDQPPQLVEVANLNRDSINELLFAYPLCDDDDSCEYQTRLVTWSEEFGRFVSLLGQPIIADNVPEVIDMDSDDIYELVVRLDSVGNAITGPLRTGVNIYDWDGAVYVLSIVQLDPPTYRVQIVHEADRMLIDGDLEQAVALYQRALRDDSLRSWRNDETNTLRSYILYRQLTMFAVIGVSNVSDVMDSINEQYADESWVYAEMARVFWRRLATSEDIGAACDAVINFVAQTPEALDTINNYGNRNPVYSAADMCPF